MQETNSKTHVDSCYYSVTYENLYVKFNLCSFTDLIKHSEFPKHVLFY